MRFRCWFYRKEKNNVVQDRAPTTEPRGISIFAHIYFCSPDNLFEISRILPHIVEVKALEEAFNF